MTSKKEIEVILNETLSDYTNDLLGNQDEVIGDFDSIVEDIMERVPTNSLEDVTEFSETFNAYVGDKPAFPDNETIQLRLNLMFEELKEFAVACGEGGIDQFYDLCNTAESEIRLDYFYTDVDYPTPNLTEALDALADMRVVNDGTILAMGMQDVFDEAFKEVHRSNMSKACLTFANAETIAKAYADVGIPVEINQRGRYFVINRIEDGKILKGNLYKAPQLEAFINGSKEDREAKS